MYYVLMLVLSLFFSTAALADDPPAKGGGEKTVEQQLAEANQKNAELQRQLDAAKKGKRRKEDEDDDENDEDDEDDDGAPDLRKKVKKNRQSSEDHAKEIKQMEAAIAFNYGIDEFIKKNAGLLPKEVIDIVKQGHKEKFDGATAKANAIRAAIIQSYFSIQENVDALTSTQKEALDHYLKLTKTDKELNAAQIYENFFEPALETRRKIEKAKELGHSQVYVSDDSDIILKKTHEKQLRGLSNYKLNDVLHDQAQKLGITE